jgi:hypothetical protein
MKTAVPTSGTCLYQVPTQFHMFAARQCQLNYLWYLRHCRKAEM